MHGGCSAPRGRSQPASQPASRRPGGLPPPQGRARSHPPRQSDHGACVCACMPPRLRRSPEDAAQPAAFLSAAPWGGLRVLTAHGSLLLSSPLLFRASAGQKSQLMRQAPLLPCRAHAMHASQQISSPVGPTRVPARPSTWPLPLSPSLASCLSGPVSGANRSWLLTSLLDPSRHRPHQRMRLPLWLLVCSLLLPSCRARHGPVGALPPSRPA